jgi:dTDP-4-amino-4,6-dideoxygalactose transaminase
MKPIPYGGQLISSQEHKAVSKVLNSEFLTNGPVSKKFNQNLKKYLNTKYLLSCSSGTAALDLAFRAINLKKNDTVIMPAINFVASYNMAINLGANVYLTDVNKLTGQMEPHHLLDCIKKNRIKKIKCVILMYLGGSPENINEFYNIKKKYKFLILEDACHAFGSKGFFNNKKIIIGSNINSDISVFSFHPLKAITTGEGGCFTTRNKKYFDKANLYRNHGIVRSKKHWDYDVVENGYNYRLSDINCALGLVQIKKINKFVSTRNKIAKKYQIALSEFSDLISLPRYCPYSVNSFHLFVISINFKKIKKNKNSFFRYMKKNNIICQQHYKPLFKFKVFKNQSSKGSVKYKNSNYYFNNSVSLPIFVSLTNIQQRKIIKTLVSFIAKK